MNTGRKRKGRSDRSHVIYELIVGNKTYVGLTFVRARSVPKTMLARIKQHWYNAHVHKKDWCLSKALRKLDCIEDVEYRILEKVQGKEAAHAVEIKMIAKLKPKLNTDTRAMKKRAA